MRGNYSEGLKTGDWIENASNDATKSSGPYLNGKKHGAWVMGHSRLFGKSEGSFYNGFKRREMDCLQPSKQKNSR